MLSTVPKFELPIRTERITLRTLDVGDADVLWALLNDADVRRHIGTGHLTNKTDAVKDAMRFYENRGFGLLAICDSRSGRMVGFGGIIKSAYGDGQELELVCAVLQDARGQGFGSVAVRELVRWGFHVTGGQRLLSIVDEDNGDAIRLVARLGFRFLERRNETIGGPSLVYAILLADGAT